MANIITHINKQVPVFTLWPKVNKKNTIIVLAFPNYNQILQSVKYENWCKPNSV